MKPKTKSKQGLRFFLDPIANTLCLWVGDQQAEVESEMNDDGDIIMMGKKRKVIGFEKLNFLPEPFFKQLQRNLSSKALKQLGGNLA